MHTIRTLDIGRHKQLVIAVSVQHSTVWPTYTLLGFARTCDDDQRISNHPTQKEFQQEQQWNVMIQYNGNDVITQITSKQTRKNNNCFCDTLRTLRPLLVMLF